VYSTENYTRNNDKETRSIVVLSVKELFDTMLMNWI